MSPDNELYDAACELLAAAQRMSDAAADEHIGPAMPAALGCMAAALGALTVGCAAMSRNLGTAQRDTFDGLVHALRQAHAACEAAHLNAAVVPTSRSACRRSGDGGTDSRA
jgi:hypothetical protein